jgi:hypothetical protein
MPPRRSASYPLYIEETVSVARAVARARWLGRLAVAAWAVAVYVAYWLGQLGSGPR